MNIAIVPASEIKDSLLPRDYKKWEILPENHPTVLRRLVRELNSHSHNGFYFNGHRYNRAQLVNGHMVVSFCGREQASVLDYVISDPYGNIITASRTRCGH